MADAKGIDVSHHNGIINWAKVAADGIDFAFMKATEGTGFTDSKFAANWKGAKDNNVIRGAYHFFKPSKDGTTQANHFLSHIDLKTGDLFPVVDVETYDGSGATKFLKELKEFLDVVQTATGVPPIIYTLRSFWKNSLGNPAAFGTYPLWIVDLTNNPPKFPNGWTDYAFWQHSFEGSVDGIHGDVDLDRYNGTKTQLSAASMP